MELKGSSLRLQPTLSFAAEGEKMKALSAIFEALDESGDGQIAKKELLKGCVFRPSV